ncbi:MAG: sigma-70 family RNA polymerase sigma factor [Bryobacteraceae bacterium]|nr:sigma-70 family RNA polymerase sigma factor [Bryobacteraceae bacterium]
MDSIQHRLDLPEPAAPSGWAAGETDERLLEGLCAGDEAAYETLLDRYQQPVYSLVQRLIEDQTEASDVTQEVFLKIFRNVGSFRGQSSLKTWIYRIAVNEAHNRRRWFGRHRKAEVGLEADQNGHTWLDHLSDETRTPYDLVLNEERRLAIERALETLNPVFRAAVVLRDQEELSYEEIADVLDVSLGTVKSRILRGREALRRALLEEFEPARGLEFHPQPAE